MILTWIAFYWIFSEAVGTPLLRWAAMRLPAAADGGRSDFARSDDPCPGAKAGRAPLLAASAGNDSALAMARGRKVVVCAR